MRRTVGDPVDGLPCGCRRGFYLCPVAERLWREAGAVWQRCMAEGGWGAYERAHAAYLAHVEGRQTEQTERGA
jgi:hypothetical protein